MGHRGNDPRADMGHNDHIDGALRVGETVRNLRNTMRREDETITDKIAQTVQEGHTAKLSSHDVATRIVALVEQETRYIRVEATIGGQPPKIADVKPVFVEVGILKELPVATKKDGE